jgi:hypothetical protein
MPTVPILEVWRSEIGEIGKLQGEQGSRVRSLIRMVGRTYTVAKFSVFRQVAMFARAMFADF